MRLKGMNGRMFGPRAGDFSQKPFARQNSVSAVIGNVIKDPDGIGFFAAAPDFPVDKRVRLLPIAKDEKSEAVVPSIENVYHGKYPIVNNLRIYVHPAAPPEAEQSIVVWGLFLWWDSRPHMVGIV